MYMIRSCLAVAFCSSLKRLLSSFVSSIGFLLCHSGFFIYPAGVLSPNFPPTGFLLWLVSAYHVHIEKTIREKAKPPTEKPQAISVYSQKTEANP